MKKKGIVRWFNNRKGFGFIALDEQEQGSLSDELQTKTTTSLAESQPRDIFVHFSVIRTDGYKTLKEGQGVEFILVQGQKGLQAEEVIPLD